jgi:tRNA-specific 2-thiouridylase
VLGKHEGIHLYTYGQSKGIGLSHHEKLFVVKIDAETNTVWVGDEKDLYSSSADMVDAHWLSELNEGDVYNIKIRYQHRPAKAKIQKTEQGYKILFDEKQKSITPGQAAVIYKDQKLMGGGWITL